MPKTFKEGDLVRLVSGGPIMNIERIENSVIVCIWFDKQDVFRTERFVAKNLVKVGIGIHDDSNP